MNDQSASRRRTTPRSVRRRELFARVMVGVGGAGTIVAVLFIFVFLFSVVLPLLSPADVGAERALPVAGAGVVACGVDDLSLVAWTLHRDGRLRVASLGDGRLLSEESLFEGSVPEAWSLSPDGWEFAAGFADGSVRRGAIRNVASYPEVAAVPPALRSLAPGESAPWDDGMLLATRNGPWRRQGIAAEVAETVSTGTAAVVALDFLTTPKGDALLAVLSADGRLALHEEVREENWLTEETTVALETTEIPFEARAADAGPPRLLLQSGRSSLFLLWKDGVCRRYDTRPGRAPLLVESRDISHHGKALTCVNFLLGRTTLAVGDEAGGLRAFCVTKPEGAETVDGGILTLVHDYPSGSSAVTALVSSRRSRVLLAGSATGEVRLLQTTTEALLAMRQAGKQKVEALGLAPKEDGFLVLGPERTAYFRLDLKHAEATLSSLLGRVWYEGYEKPEHVWQSTGGSDDFEPKYGLMPLIFGTLKATLFSLLFAAPLALLAALFTSEFMVARWRTGTKSAVEMMASIPSVVLGFLAALILAPFVEDKVPAVLVAFVAVPLSVLLGARLWQILPTAVSAPRAGLTRFLCIGAFLPVGLLLARWLGPRMEAAWFTGDFRAWLDGRGDAFGGWFLLLFPLALAFAAILSVLHVSPRIRRRTRGLKHRPLAFMDLAQFAAGVLVAAAAATLLASLFAGFGWDVRGGLFDRYSQRNALIVGAAMGFAIIPVIYTIAEDALSSVPQALREASLGAGATTWQTAWRVVIPAAMSGLVGALMVGLGRAVGETMIVLMAAGNTPIMEWNIFEGFRTLSANIATEMMEAPQGSTHYRVLFLAALVLFAMTFALNTGVELLRRSYRKRFAEL